MKSWFLAPAGDDAKLAEGLASGADALVLDISQSKMPNVEQARLSAERFLARRPLSPIPVYVLVHSAGSGLLQDDIASLVPAAPAGIVLAHADGGVDLQALDVMIAVQEALAGLPVGDIRIVALSGDHGGVAFSGGSYHNKSGRLEALGWWQDRAARSIGISRIRESDGRLASPLDTIRSLTLLGASKAGVEAIDTPSPGVDIERFRIECDTARGDGFAGKIAVDAEQTAVINAVFGA